MCHLLPTLLQPMPFLPMLPRKRMPSGEGTVDCARMQAFSNMFSVRGLSSLCWPPRSPNISSATTWLYSPLESSPLSSTTRKPPLFEKVLLSVTVLFIFFKGTSCLLLHHLFCSEPLRCLFLPQPQWGCRLKCHRWPSNQQMKQPFAQFPFCLSSCHIRQWWLIPPGSYLGHWLRTLLSWHALCFSYSLFSVSPDPSSSFYFKALSSLASELFSEISRCSASSSPQSFWFSTSNPSTVPEWAFLHYILYLWVSIPAIHWGRLGPVRSIQCHPLFQDLLKEWPSLSSNFFLDLSWTDFPHW